MLPCHKDLIDSTAVHSITICENSPSWDFPPKSTDFNEMLHSSACFEERNLMGWQFQSIPAPVRWKISNETCYHCDRNQEWHKKKFTLQGSSRHWRNIKNEQARSCTWVEENAKQNVEPWILKDLLSLKRSHGLSTTEMLVILPLKPTKE